MDKLDRINWNPRYTVHAEALDLQHQKLFDITNKLLDKYESGSDQCYEIIEELVDYLSKHFHAEQLLMMELNYPEYQKHMEAHKYFIDKVEAFLYGYRNGAKNLTDSMLAFLRDWIFSHTTTFDLKYGEYLLKSRQQK